MSRSRRKTPIGSWCGSASEKDDKRICNRKLRHTNKIKLNHYEDDTIFMIQDESLSAWDMNKDGKMYFGDMKNDPTVLWDGTTWHDEYIKLMRK